MKTTAICIYEWVEGVKINNRVWKITDPDGSTRNVNAGTSNDWITNIAAENGPFFDVVPTNICANASMYYSDYYDRTSGNSIVLARSYSAHVYEEWRTRIRAASRSALSASWDFGSRLAFRGIISEVAPEQFKKNCLYYNIIF